MAREQFPCEHDDVPHAWAAKVRKRARRNVVHGHNVAHGRNGHGRNGAESHNAVQGRSVRVHESVQEDKAEEDMEEEQLGDHTLAEEDTGEVEPAGEGASFVF